MNKNAFIGLFLTGMAVLLTVLTSGLLLPFMLPLFLYGAKFLGLKIE